MLFCLASLALIDSLEQLGETSVDCDAFVGPVVLLQAPSSVAQALFDRPPTRVMIHNPEATEGLHNRTTITVVVSEDAGNALGMIVLRQLPNLDQWVWGRLEPQFISATIPFAAKEQEDWPQLLSQALKRI